MNKEHAIQLTFFIKRFQEEKPLYSFQTQPLTMMPYYYGKAMDDFLHYFLDNHLVLTDCWDIEDEFLKNYKDSNWQNDLNEKQVMQSISYIIRKDRFVDGFISSNIDNGVILSLLNRLKTLYNL